MYLRNAPTLKEPFHNQTNYKREQGQSPPQTRSDYVFNSMVLKLRA